MAIITLLDRLKDVAADYRYGVKGSIDLLRSYIRVNKNDDNTLLNITSNLVRLKQSVNNYVVTYEEASKSENAILMRYLSTLDMMSYPELNTDYTELDVLMDDDKYDINSLPVNTKQTERPKPYDATTKTYVDNTVEYGSKSEARTIKQPNLNNSTMAPMSLISFQYYLSVFQDIDPNSELGKELLNCLKEYLDYQAIAINNPIHDSSKAKLNTILNNLNTVRDKITSSQTEWVDNLNQMIQESKFNEAYAVFVENSNTTNPDLEELLRKYYKENGTYLKNVIIKKLQEVVSEIL